MAKKEVPIYEPKNQKDWRNWLKSNHNSEQSVWVIFYRVSSENHNLTWSEAVDEALCFGWIDSTKKRIDDEKFKQFFSRRKPKSTWSKINKEKVEVLLKKKLIAPAGMEAINKAKENGSWTLLDSIDQLIIPDDLDAALSKNPDAKDYFLSLSKSIRKMLLYWVFSAKRTETRKKRIDEIVSNALNEEKPKAFR